MKVTVCELNDESDLFAQDWERLVLHVRDEQSELVLLPEMPFTPWFCLTETFSSDSWQNAIAQHDAWLTRIAELAPATVLATRPVNLNGRRLNEGFSWSPDKGYSAVHHKYHLPNEPGFWEASWYERGDGSFTVTEAAQALIGFQICTELWSMENARLYGLANVDILATPRATPKTSLHRWLIAGQAAAIVSGAFSLSSNHLSTDNGVVQLGGQGWIISPDGDVLGVTSRDQPFVTAEIDLNLAKQAKLTYPRYVLLK